MKALILIIAILASFAFGFVEQGQDVYFGSVLVRKALSVPFQVTEMYGLVVSGDLEVGGDLEVTGDVEFAGIVVADSLALVGGATVGGDLEVTGDADLGGDLEVTGMLTALGAALDSLDVEYAEIDKLLLTDDDGFPSIAISQSWGKFSGTASGFGQMRFYSDSLNSSQLSLITLSTAGTTTGSTITSGNITVGLNPADVNLGPGLFQLKYTETDLTLQTGIAPTAIGEILAVFTDSGTVDFPGDFTAGTIEADNGWTGTWINAGSDTVHVVGGIIVDVASP